MRPDQLALARTNSYRLTGRLFLSGLQDESLPYVQAVPELAPAVPTPFDADEAAAAHQHLFGFHLFPYQSYFLDPSGLLGGSETERVQHHYQRQGFEPEPGHEADHLGQELLFLATLCQQEAQAWQQENAPAVTQRQQAQATFLRDDLLRWLSPCLLAVERQKQPFYRALAGITAAVLHDHAQSLAVAEEGGRTLPPFPEPPAGSGTTLRQIADYLLTPALSGFYLGREDVIRLGRGLNVPRGFGSGRLMLTNLLRAAGQYEQVDALFAALQVQVVSWQTAYEQWRDSYPAFAPFVAPWQTRTAGTLAWLEGLAEQVKGMDLGS